MPAAAAILREESYKGHNAPAGYKFKVYTQAQKRGVTGEIKRQFRRRAAIEPVIGHTKSEHRMERNYLAHRAGDAINAVLPAAGSNVFGRTETKTLDAAALCKEPTAISHDTFAQLLAAMDAMRSGIAIRLFQAPDALTHLSIPTSAAL